MNEKIVQLKVEVEEVLKNNILSYWKNNLVDIENGGFLGQITGDEIIKRDAPKGAVLNARILWTYSAAYRVLKDDAYVQIAKRAKDLVLDCFYDKKGGGI